MTCEKASEVISDYIDGLLPHHTRCEYETHISSCAKCALELDETRRVLSSLSLLAVRDSSVDLWPALRTAIMERGRPTSLWRFLLRPVIAAPVAAVVTALAVIMALPSHTELPKVRKSASVSYYGHYITAHTQFQRHKVFVDPDVTFVAAELEKARLTDSD
ncbi:MAG: zf-HC2 domain-containing protein [Armatimonadetes bacterium]|nr:zf-HC2 domain-containing protein [Armatimonadota bacterium]